MTIFDVRFKDFLTNQKFLLKTLLTLEAFLSSLFIFFMGRTALVISLADHKPKLTGVCVWGGNVGHFEDWGKLFFFMKKISQMEI